MTGCSKVVNSLHHHRQADVSIASVTILLAVCGDALRALSCLGWAHGRAASAAVINASKEQQCFHHNTCSAAKLYLTVQGLKLLCCLPLRRCDPARHHPPVLCSPLQPRATMSAHSKTRHMLSVYMQLSHGMHSPSTCVSGTYKASNRFLVAISSASAICVSPSHLTAEDNYWNVHGLSISHASPVSSTAARFLAASSGMPAQSTREHKRPHTLQGIQHTQQTWLPLSGVTSCHSCPDLGLLLPPCPASRKSQNTNAQACVQLIATVIQFEFAQIAIAGSFHQAATLTTTSQQLH